MLASLEVFVLVKGAGCVGPPPGGLTTGGGRVDVEGRRIFDRGGKQGLWRYHL